MSDNCNNQCSTCSQKCGDRKEENSFLAPENSLSHVKKVIGVVSGKGGVGKSLVTSLLACGMKRRGAQTAVLDADITGPSIPKAFGIHGKVYGTEDGMIQPAVSARGTKVVSLNLLMDEETSPVVWRGPVIANVVKQFWSDVIWGDVDYMFVDMPPGTGDVPLTVFQSLPVDGIVVVTTPQELVNMIVAKAVNMAGMMNVPVLGLVENMSYLECPDCGKRISVFGESRIEKTAADFSIDTFVQTPIRPELAQACDAGRIEEIEAEWMDGLLDNIEKISG